MKKLISKSFTLWMAIVLAGLLAACSDGKVAGGVTEDAGLAIKDLDVAGLAQKGPFVKGSAVTVQGVDCKTMKFTEEKFSGKVKSNKGDFDVDDVNLSASCALFEVSGYYLNEVSGEKSSDKLTLHAITDLNDRKSVNINVLTELEYERVMKLVSEEKMSFDDAKMQAEKEVLASLGVMDRFESFEGMSIYEKGEGNATLLATSVLLQSDLDAEKLAGRMDDIASSITKNGEWNDEKAKAEMADWASTAKSDGKYEAVRKNLEKWSGSDEVPDFEKVIEEINDAQKIPEGWSWDVPKEARLNPNIKYDTMIDPRDKQVYKIVKISPKGSDYSQVWMAENLNYADSVKTPSLKGQNWCYNNDEKNCKVSGRYYTWAAAIDSVTLANDSKNPLNCGYGKTCGINRGVQGICPDGWHLPTLHEWGLLSVALGNAGVAGDSLKALTGWDYAGTADNNGVDAYGFAALPTGRMVSTSSWSNVGSNVYYWSSEEDGTYEAQYSNINNIYTKFYLFQGSKKYGQSVRCIKGDPSTAAIKSSSSSSVGETKSSSSSAKSSSSAAVSSSSYVVTKEWSWDVPKEARFNPNIKYDSMIDPRDKRVYKVVKIEVKERDYSKVWMAENLNYSDSVRTPSLKGKSWCYRDSAKYCEVSGRYYTWAAAIDSVALVSDTVAPLDCGYGKTCELGEQRIQGICPDGWHLPNRDEWGWLSVYLGNAGVAGDTLKALTGWDYAGTENNNGVDAYGFTALPTGRRVSETSWRNIGSDVYYWTSQEEDAYEAQYSNMNNQYTKFYLYQGSKTYGQSVRCVKD
ncbi:MAG: fibrobacter succinogenes major paralogous domain-containing protein [Fibrobacter sp.]|nr:fibrobacter succinogenes major paralogous domain-containing protein [Fibrobacter sp.]